MDIKSILQSLSDHKVRFLVIGAWALPAHGYVRATEDIDIFIQPTKANAARTVAALKSVGYDVLADVALDTVLKKKVLLRQYLQQTDVHPFVKGASFQRAWKSRQQTEIDGVRVFVPSLEVLIAMKRAAGRGKDAEDLRALKAIKQKMQERKKKEG